jgi:CopG family transcriptional regulator, nickel-responsive regulator
MPGLVRFSVSIEKPLSDRFDRHIRGKKYSNRSEAVRDMIRAELLREEWRAGGNVAGAVTMVYDHHKRDLVGRLTNLQHDYLDVIVSTQHIHIDHHHCLEIIAVRGAAAKIKDLADRLRASKGVLHGTLSITRAAHAH